MAFATIPEILDDIRAGRMFVLVDDENRENEGDITIAAEKVTPEAINFMARFARGLVCLAMTEEKCASLGLPMMVESNTSRFGTAFTVSVDAASGVSTGISAFDRAHTILTAIRDKARPEDLVRPGHIFPLRARTGGVLVRAGQTEGSVDLARLAGLDASAVICEVMKDDGTMARVPDLEEFCAQHDLKMCSIAELIQYRRRKERLIEKLTVTKLPSRYGEFTLHLYKSLVDEYLHMAICAGDIGAEVNGEKVVHPEPILVRVHSECLTGDIFGSMRCDCGEQLQSSLLTIARAGKGVVLYIRQEGRGIGLENKLRAYALQDQGLDTVEANQKLGLPADLREYGIGAQILLDLGIRKLSLLTNNPRKIVALGGYGLEVAERHPIEALPTQVNARYLRTKRDKLGHLLSMDAEPAPSCDRGEGGGGGGTNGDGAGEGHR
ncbi:MAG: bifunctional 3,4-dihydroxy-2-butanone-4-phosphate synthase/GTP cyclohydrolase II [Planctomycetes bacterium]|nr:bifunctional 3,4-dihydroxy-2-butanone-4-phosphate synthase/GTP cyclohydrolase II [Planctomycetota bacterium]